MLPRCGGRLDAATRAPETCTMSIHPTAIIDAQADLDPSVDVGPYAVIEGPVRIGPGTKVLAHAYLTGWTTIGANCEVHPFAVIGAPPQDLKYHGAESYVRVGDETILREGVSVHRGTEPGSSTVVGARCFLMGYSHVAHNCRLDDDVKLANGVMLAGWVEVGANVFMGGGAGVHQFTRIGELCVVRGNAEISCDVPPFFMAVQGSTVLGLNLVGLRRAGFSGAEIEEIKQAYKLLYRSGLPFRKAVAMVAERVTSPPGHRLVEFLRAPSKRGFAHGPRGNRAAPRMRE